MAGALAGLVLVLAACLPVPMDFRSVAAIGAALVAIFVSIHVAEKTVRGEAAAHEFALLGFAVFGFGDATKYLIDEGPRVLRPETEKTVLLYLAISFTLYCAVTWRTGRPRRVSSRLTTEKEPRWRFLVPVVLFVAPLYWYMRATNQGAFTDVPGALLKACVIVLVYGGLRYRRKLVLLSSIAVALVALPDSSRRAFVVTVAPLILLLVDDSAAQSVLRRKAVYGAAAALFILLNALRATHDYGEGFDASDPVGNTINYMVTLRSLDTFYNTGYVVESIPDQFPYRLGDTYAAVFVAPIPRSVWPGKPVGFAAPLAMMQAAGVPDFDPDQWMGLNQYSLSPGFMGEALANFGLPGLLGVTLLLGLVVRWSETVTSRVQGMHRWTLRNIWFLPVLGSFTLIGRGDFYVSVNYSLPIAIFVAMLVRLIRPSEAYADLDGIPGTPSSVASPP